MWSQLSIRIVQCVILECYISTYTLMHLVSFQRRAYFGDAKLGPACDGFLWSTKPLLAATGI